MGRNNNIMLFMLFAVHVFLVPDLSMTCIEPFIEPATRFLHDTHSPKIASQLDAYKSA